MQFWWAAGSVRTGWAPWRWPYVDVSFYDQVADFQNFLSRSYSKNLRKMTELTKILGKSYEKPLKILRRTYDELTKKLRNAKKVSKPKILGRS